VAEDACLTVGESIDGATVTQVDANGFHAAAVLSDGRVRCWGGYARRAENRGQCDVPTDLGPAIAVSAGLQHTAALLEDGRIVCWGGHGTRDAEKCNVPDGLERAVSVSAGGSHTAAVLADGRIACWGWNDAGQCEVPAGLGPATSIAAGLQHTVALLADGRVRCWGSDGDGQCSVPEDLGSATAVAAGLLHSAVLLADGRVVCWGAEGAEAERSCQVPSWPGRAVAISARAWHTAALLEDGQTRVWGRRCQGVPWHLEARHVIDLLGTSGDAIGVAFGARLLNRVPRQWIKQQALGEAHGIALVEDGRVVCWGSGRSGQCRTPAGLGPVTSVAAGLGHNVALRADGRAVCWGYDEDGQCMVPAGLGRVTQVAAGGTFTAAVLDDDRIRVWGSSCRVLPWEVPDAQLIDLLISSGAALHREFGERLVARLPDGMIKARCDAQDHSVALLADGRVICWDEPYDCAASRVPAALQGRAVEVYADASSTWAFDVDGRLHGWGVVEEVGSLPFELSDEAWLEFATRMWGKTKQKIYPEHVRKSAAFKAIRAMHRLAKA